jgi:putative ABC transport system permease protein
MFQGCGGTIISRSSIFEGLVIGLRAWVFAIGLSYSISSAPLYIIGQSMAGSTFSLTFTPFGVLLWLVIVIVLSIIASILPARNAARLTINEVLAYE